MTGKARSLTDFMWSPARIPKPPEYIGKDSCIPNSQQK